MNILFIHEVDWLKKVVFEIHNLAEFLSLHNHNVYAIDYENTWEKTGFWDLGTFKTQELTGVSRAIAGSSVSLRRPGYVKIPGLSRTSAAITHYFEIKRIIKEKKIDVIMLYSVPTNGLQTLGIARRYKVPVVFRSIDMLHNLVQNPVLRLTTRYLERKVYARSDAILAITPNHARYVIKMRAEKEKVKPLPMPIDTTLFYPGIDSHELQKKWGFKKEDKIILFIGTLFSFSGLDGFIREFPRILEKVPEAKLLIVGDGIQRKKLEVATAELGLGKNIIFTGFQPYQTMPQYISLSTLCINPFLITEETKDIFPGKIIQYIACGKVAVVTPLLGITTLIPDESKGVMYTDNASDMADKVADLLTDDEKRHSKEQAGIAYVREVHDQQKIGRQLELNLFEIIKSYNNSR